MVSDGAPTGECLGIGDCVVTMDSDKTVTAPLQAIVGGALLAPNGGETIVGGSGYTVHWGASANAVTFTLAYSFGASSPWKVIDTG